jgi:predicted ribosome quality control (RQC) complex YloA/Tae2 family protein
MKNINITNGKIFNIKIGENAKENTELVKSLKLINENYIWFHLSSFPSPHVILEEMNPSLDLILKCAEKCREYSKYKFMKNIYVDYTSLKNVEITDTPGEVEFIANSRVKKVMI